MDSQTTDNLTSLIKLDIDAVSAYIEALEHIENQDVYANLNKFMHDHNHHIENLSQVLRTVGRQSPERTKDIKGFFIKGFTSLRSVTGDEGALKAMHMNEQLTNKKYKEAVEEWNLELTIKEVVESNYRDEQEHLAYIEEAIENRVWEKTTSKY